MIIKLITDSSFGWRPEIELLLYCVRSPIDTTTASRIENLLQQDLDWNYLLQQACQHGVFLLLHHNLFKSYPQAIPKNIQPQVQAYCQIKTARNLFLSKKLCQILNLFETHHIQVIPFKGPVLAAYAYHNLALREFCDLDFLIDENDFPKAKDLLLSQGYQPRSEPQQWGQDFAAKDGNIHLDFHWQLAPSCFPYDVDFQKLSQRCQMTSLLSQQVTHLCPEDLLLILCIQIVKDTHHRQERLIQICDIAALIQTSLIDWKAVNQQAQTLGSERSLWFGLSIAKELLGIEIPLQLEQKITSDLVVNLYIKHILEQLFTTVNKQQRVFGIFYKGLLPGLYGFLLRGLMLLQTSAITGKHNRKLVKHLLDYVLTPNSRDLQYVSIPRHLHFLYYFIRAIRLAGKFVNSSVPKSQTALASASGCGTIKLLCLLKTFITIQSKML